MMKLLHQPVDANADRRPDKPAFLCNQDTISFRELSESRSRLANALMDQGVHRGDRVGILMPRCSASAIAVHGILKAEAVYVPLDPGSSPEYLSEIVTACGIRTIVTWGIRTALVQAVLELCPTVNLVFGCEPLSDRVRFLNFDEVDTYPDQFTRSQLVGEEDLAYIIFTSGSTGRPKGIMHTHRSGMAYARLAVETYGIMADDVIGSHSPLHFDMSTLGYFGGPLAGATCSLIPDAHTRLPASLSALMEAHRITVWYSVPFALIQLLTRGALELRDLKALRWVLFAGEPLGPKHLRRLMQVWPHARFSNVYGPAEVNQCTYFNVPSSMATSDGHDVEAAIPIGRVWRDTIGLVVDAEDQPVASGESGELLIHSPTMMLGYWGQDDLNQKCFCQRVSPQGVEQLFYRTGDLVIENPSGDYMFLGRKDRQMKIRGYRVELDAVELALNCYSCVEESGVVACNDDEGMTHLRAVVTVSGGTSVTAQDLVAFVSQRLPHYAVPREILFRQALPRTATGKIDRRQLAAIT